MMLQQDSHLEDYLFLYAKVLGIFHINVLKKQKTGSSSKLCQIENFQIWWYKYNGFNKSARLYKVSFPSIFEEESFGLVHPAKVLRTCHIIPDFAQEKNIGSNEAFIVGHNDWTYYYVNRQVLYKHFRSKLITVSFQLC